MSAGIYKDLFETLGLTETAGPEELRRAYLALAVKYHPDRNPGDPAAEQRFKEISEAYAILSDPEAKARYGRMREAAGARASSSTASGRTGPKQSASAGPSSPKTEAGSSKTAEPDLEERLAAFFKSARGRDILKDLAGELKKAGLDFSPGDLADWLKRKRAEASEPPKGGIWDKILGGIPGTEAHARRGLERFDLTYSLPLTARQAAEGLSLEINHSVGGEPAGHLRLQIPAGTKDGDRFRIPGRGYARPGAGRGDLFIAVKVNP